MGDEPELIRAILAAPEADGPRLAYADWLGRAGDPFSDFIRVQCRLARTEPNDPACATLRDTEQQLFTRHAASWLGVAVARLLFGEEYDPHNVIGAPDSESEDMAYRFVRGWLDYLTLVWMEPVYRHWRELLPAALHAPACSLLRVFESWYIDQDESWDAPAGPVSDPLDALTEGPPLPQVRILKLGGPEVSDYMQGRPRQTAAVLPSLLDKLPRLEELHLNAFGVDYGRVLDPARLPTLRRLRLTCACATDGACAAVASSGVLRQLEVLEIVGTRRGQLTQAGLHALAEGIGPFRLRRLDVSHNHWPDPERVAALLRPLGAQEVVVQSSAENRFSA
jgi:uncharacterized protein (TIGR02996 family)